MKVTFKDLKQQKFTFDFDPSTLVSGVKEKLQEERGWDAKDQKLIYSGKILKDDQSLESYNIEEKGYVVCMVSKPKPKPAAAPAEPATPAPASASTSTPAAPAAPAPSSASTQAAAPSTPTPQRTTSSGAAFNDPSNLMVGAERAEAITNMEAMGFERAQIERAMRAAFFNPDRAVEYLLTGIPENTEQESRPAQPAAAAAPAAGAPGDDNGDDDGDDVNLFDLAAQRGGSGDGAAAAAGGPGDTGVLDFLRNSSQFQQLRQVVQQNPQMLEPLLQQLGAGNPSIARMIADNPEQFLDLLSEGIDESVLPPRGGQTIEVTEAERDAIERLCRLGFDRDQAIQAYFACDKDEQLAANFLFDQPEEDDPAPGH